MRILRCPCSNEKKVIPLVFTEVEEKHALIRRLFEVASKRFDQVEVCRACTRYTNPELFNTEK